MSWNRYHWSCKGRFFWLIQIRLCIMFSREQKPAWPKSVESMPIWKILISHVVAQPEGLQLRSTPVDKTALTYTRHRVSLLSQRPHAQHTVVFNKHVDFLFQYINDKNRNGIWCALNDLLWGNGLEANINILFCSARDQTQVSCMQCMCRTTEPHAWPQTGFFFPVFQQKYLKADAKHLYSHEILLTCKVPWKQMQYGNC